MATLLDAVAGFLTRDLAAVKGVDPALGFRVAIAASLVQMVASELRQEDDHDEAQLGRLVGILGDGGAMARRGERHAAMRAMEATLARMVREGDDSQAVRDHVVATLRERLAVTNPRFDLSPDIE